jgi:hypothetical protein
MAGLLKHIKSPVEQETDVPEDPTAPAVGRWYWVQDRDHNGKKLDRWLGCVIHLGSNHAELEGPSGDGSYYTSRVLFSEFKEECEFEPNHQAVIDKNVAARQLEIRQLMGKVQEITAQLSITMGPTKLESKNEAQSLALRDGGESLKNYKKALTKAKEKTLPKLFDEIESANRSIAVWMKANLIPLQAQANALKPLIKTIENRIFHVELYAGLVEEVEQIKDGKPAHITEKIHLFQRRAYMDEECLAEYKVGGMEFKNIRDFDKWMAHPDNFTRLLPMPRCIVAFQVRRLEKEREFPNYRAYVNFIISGEKNLDKLTFLYMRNGEQLFRLRTGIEFGEQLFPDMKETVLTGQLWAVMNNGIRKIIDDGEHDQILAEQQKKIDEYERNKAAAIAKGVSEDEMWMKVGSEPHFWEKFVKYSPDSVDYDDINRFIQHQVDHHNRLVVVLQGLIDRSPVMHPHPPWQLWTPDGFEQALQLIYDDTRTFTTGEKPDFEAYRERLNVLLKRGSVTVGQDDYWARVEAQRENERADRSWRRTDHNYEHFRPYGNRGPGDVARVMKFSPTRGCTFNWMRDRIGPSFDGWGRKLTDKIPCTITVPVSKLFNVSAYKPGDFKQFFNDPRTRADYIQWAPFLLEAEEYHAGNRKVAPLPEEEKPEATTKVIRCSNCGDKMCVGKFAPRRNQMCTKCKPI